jgi:hypothetical protein
MIDGIRRRLRKAAAGDTWGADEELEPEIEEDAKPPREIAFLVTATQATGRYAPDDPSAPDYYMTLVRNAIGNGGRHGDQSISIPWLRMILAGLESKQIEPETMWYGIEAGETRREPVPEVPSYEDLFQTGRDV